MIKTIIWGLVLTLAVVTFASETTKGMKKDYESFKVEMSRQLDTVEKKIADLKVKAKQKGSTAQEETAESLEKTRAKLKEQLAEAKETSQDGWSKFKSGFADSVDKLNTKLQKAVKD